MNKKLALCIAMMGALYAAGCGDHVLSPGCTVGDMSGEKNKVIYTCNKDLDGNLYWETTICEFGYYEDTTGEKASLKCYECDLNNGEKLKKCENSIMYKCDVPPNASDSNKKYGVWIKQEVCVNQCESDSYNSKCKCQDNCVNGCNVDGTCTPVEKCSKADITGACISCKHGVITEGDDIGKCIYPECVITGEEGHLDDGECKLVSGCTGHDETGACVCKNGTDPDGKCTNVCVEEQLFVQETGECKCSESCTGDCYYTGACITSTSCIKNEDCNEYSYCAGDQCRCDGSYCNPIDKNHNNMRDEYEVDRFTSVGVKLNKELKLNIDCYSKPDGTLVGNRANQDKYCAETLRENIKAASSSLADANSYIQQLNIDENNNQVFCDSFIDYKCSIKCTKDEQCVDGFICRKESEDGDGRCAADSFTTVWDSNLRQHTLELNSSSNSCNVYVCWDWSEGGNEIIEADDSLPEFKNARCPYAFEKITKCGTIKHNYIETNVYHGNDLNSDITVKIYGNLDGFSVSNSENYRQCDLGNGYRYFTREIQKINNPERKENASCFRVKGETNSTVEVIESIECKIDVNEKDYACANTIRNYKGNNLECFGCIYNPGPGRSNLKAIKSFGRVGLGWHIEESEYNYYSIDKYKGAFHDCYHLKEISSIDIPDPSKLDMTCMFRGNCVFNYPIEHWDVSQVVSMNKTFWVTNCQPGSSGGTYPTLNHPTFNQPLGKWDVSHVKNMDNMFGGSPFDQPINDWDVSNVESMAGMFAQAADAFIYNHFNQPLNEWDVSNVRFMADLFLNAHFFNQDLSNWEVMSEATKYRDDKGMVTDQDSNILDGSGMSKENICKIIQSSNWKSSSFKAIIKLGYICN